MAELWLRANPRPIYVAMVVPCAGITLATVLVLGVMTSNWSTWLAGLALLVGILSICGLVVLGLMLKLPRLAYLDGHLQLNLGPRSQFQLPIDVIECFFPGQGPVVLPDSGQGVEQTAETMNVIVRLSESAEEWKHRDVDRAYGHWCDGYIIIRGTWCERINGPLIARLNAKLVDAHRQKKLAEQTIGAAST